MTAWFMAPSVEFTWQPLACWQRLKRLNTTTQGQRARGIKTAKLKEGKTFTYSKRPIYWRTPERCTSREKFAPPLGNLKGEKTPGSIFIIFIKQSSFTLSATRAQLQRNQMHLFTPEQWSSLTAAFRTLLVKCTHWVALFSCQVQECSAKLLWHSNDL